MRETWAKAAVVRVRGALGAMALFGAGAVGACGDDGSDPVIESVPCDPAADPRGAPLACAAGAIVASDGTPAAGVRVSACTLQTCIIGTTDANGRYAIQSLPVVPHKMEILGNPKGFMTMVYHQEMTPGMLAVAPREVVLPRLGQENVAWPSSGGTAVVAGGKLELSSTAGDVSYPIGTEDESLDVAVMPIDDLPPFDNEPWVGKESKSFAFVVNPFPMKVEGAIGLKVLGAKAKAGAPYRLYSADHLAGTLHEVGSLVADDQGDIVLQPGATLEDLTTIVIAPN